MLVSQEPGLEAKRGVVPAAICQDVAIPSLQFVGAPDCVEDLLAGLEAEMVGVVEAETASGSLELFGSESLERSLSGYGHKYGEVYGAVGEG